MSDVEEVLDIDDDNGPADVGSEPASADESQGGAAKKGRSAKAKAAKDDGKNGKLKIVNKFGKTRSRTTKGGKKFCPACGKWLPAENFPPGSGQCGDDRKVIQNLKNAAIAQDQLAWWNEVCQDPEKLKKVLKAYRESAPPPGKRRKTPFSILQYREERRQESSTLLDGVAEMMSELAYISWMAKPKNGCVDALEASARWKDLFNAPGAITDSKGPTEKYKNRVAVHKADLVTQRDANIHSQGYVAAEKEIRKGSQEDIDRMEARLAKETMFKATNSRSRTDQALSMAKASLASGGTGAWSDNGKSAAMIGDVRDLLSESENEGSQASCLRCWAWLRF